MNTVKREEKNAQFNGEKERWVSIIVADALKIVTIKRNSTKRIRKQVNQGLEGYLYLRDCRECRKPSRPTSSSGQSESPRRALSGVSFQAKHPMEYLVNCQSILFQSDARTYQLLLN